MKQIRLWNVDGKQLPTHTPSLVELKAWLAGTEPRSFTSLNGGRFLVDPARIVAVDRFVIRVGSARWHRYWTR